MWKKIIRLRLGKSLPLGSRKSQPVLINTVAFLQVLKLSGTHPESPLTVLGEYRLSGFVRFRRAKGMRFLSAVSFHLSRHSSGYTGHIGITEILGNVTFRP